MGKESRPRVLADNQAKAIGRNIRISPRKLNLVAQSIRGRSAEAALAALTFSPKRIAQDVKKILQSAIANAENNHDLDVDDLVVSEASVGRNLVMKRFHARARGRGARIEKPFSQITIVVEEKREEKPAPAAKPRSRTAKAGAAAATGKPASTRGRNNKAGKAEAGESKETA
jgi:large subunit ribosomal protein L22